MRERRRTTQTFGTPNTLFQCTGVCEKRFPTAPDVEGLYTPPPLFNVGGAKIGVVCCLRKKIPFLRGCNYTAISSTLKRRGRGQKNLQTARLQKEPFFAGTGIKKDSKLDDAGGAFVQCTHVVSVCACMHACTNVCKCASMYACMHACMYVCLYMCMY